jgi:hypothetical protein
LFPLCFSPNDLARWKETRLLQTFLPVLASV